MRRTILSLATASFVLSFLAFWGTQDAQAFYPSRYREYSSLNLPTRQIGAPIPALPRVYHTGRALPPDYYRGGYAPYHGGYNARNYGAPVNYGYRGYYRATPYR